MLPNPETCRFVFPDDLAKFEGVIVDVRTPEAYAEAHIAGATNHCVYQIDFLVQFPEMYPIKESEILVYGDGDPYKADLAAFGRLHNLGYKNVSILKGGLIQWLAGGGSVEGLGPKTRDTEAHPKRYGLDVGNTKVRWVGRNLMNQHDGEIAATEGFIEVASSGEPLAGKVTVDMRQMMNRDIEDKSLADVLLAHLASSDFFDAEGHPKASFELISAKRINDATYGMPNYSVKGTLAARGLSVELEIEALVEPIEGGYVFQTVFNFDRTQIGAFYGSGRIFERLGMHLVSDLVSVDVAALFTVSK